jgi:thiol-disulfide isomerase/thioredoxin
MARTPSTMLALGTAAPNFTLLEPATGNKLSLQELLGQPFLVAFICNHCPYVVLIKDELSRFAEQYQQQGLKVIAINSNDVANYPEDSPEKMIEFSKACAFSFPYLYDETQEIAKSYKAACTPDFFMFDKAAKLFYRGQFDGARPNSQTPVTGIDLRTAADALLSNKKSIEPQIASLGCNIKWKQGNEPHYS